MNSPIPDPATDPADEPLTVPAAPLVGFREMAAMLDLPPVRLWWWTVTGRFPVPHRGGRRRSTWRWELPDTMRWLAGAERSGPGRMPGRVRLAHWPAADQPAVYGGTHRTDWGVVQDWHIPTGTVVVAWRDPDHTFVTAKRMRHDLPWAEAIIDVETHFGIDGPSVRGVLPHVSAGPAAGYYPTSWTRLHQVLGVRLPFWADALRLPDLIEQWRPDATPPEALPTTVIDVGLWLTLAALLPDQSPARTVLTAAADDAIAGAVVAVAETDLRIIADLTTNRAGRSDSTVIAAVPTRLPKPLFASGLDDLDPSVRRAGWLEILARTDHTAAKVVREAMMWHGGVDLPYSNPARFTPTTGPGREFTARLRPAPRTAAHQVLGVQPDDTTMVDPATDAPAIVCPDPRPGHPGEIVAAIPQRLPATSPLAELILDDPVWVRTADGTLYPAPRDAHYGLSWGYGGTGPMTLACLVDRLLDDINAPGAEPSGRDSRPAPEGLLRLLRTDHPHGTVLTRERLLAARTEPA